MSSAALDRPALERRLRERIPPPREPQAREQYDSLLADWLDASEEERAVLGFGELWTGTILVLAFEGTQ